MPSTLSLVRPTLPNRMLLLVVLVVLTGCTSWKHGSRWSPGGQPALVPTPRVNRLADLVPGYGPTDPAANLLRQAQDRFDRAESLAHDESPQCVDEFYAATLLSWAAAQEAEGMGSGSHDQRQRALGLYHDSLARLIDEAQTHRRLNPAAGLSLCEGGVTRVVPINYYGFVWKPTDFRELIVVGSYWSKTLSREVARDGMGVPLVVRTRHTKSAAAADNVPPEAVFAATAVLRPDGESLDLYDPVRLGQADLGGQTCRLTRDLSAPLAYYMHFHERSRLEGFLRPTDPNEQGQLAFLEPFQHDKIPLVLVHGLLSDPRAWADVYNELRACPEIVETYQIWAFRYPTGEPFVRSSARLRSLLDTVRERHDPDHANPHLERTVLIGHSMGGLISRLLISYSGESLWNSGSKIPLEAVATSEETRAGLAERMFFDPHPMVSRVVFVATPHRGSATAGRALGRLASAMVSSSDPTFDQLQRDNPGALKAGYDRRMPTSVDLLEPDHPLLKTIRCMPLSERVKKHSIIGCGYPSFGHGDSDCVVPVTSAKLAGVESELLVHARHGQILHEPQAIAELKRILRLHAAESP